jgi:hypothetical protein
MAHPGKSKKAFVLQIEKEIPTLQGLAFSVIMSVPQLNKNNLTAHKKKKKKKKPI